MIEAELDAASVGRIRVAASPAYEAAILLGFAAAGRPHPVYGVPSSSTRAQLADPDVASAGRLLLGAVHGYYIPDFLTPKPTTPVRGDVFAGQVEAIRATTDEEAASQLDYLQRTSPFPLTQRNTLDPSRIAQRASAGLSKFWHASIVGIWPTVHTALQRDIDRRSATLVTHGMTGLLNSLDNTVRWNGHTLAIDLPYNERTELRNAEVVLVPSIMGWPRISSQLCNADDAMLTYAVRDPARPTAQAHAALLGGSRSAILSALDVARTTAQVGQLVHLAPSTVSEHLQVLTDAGLLSRSRHGRRVEYQQTNIARAMVNSVRSELQSDRSD